MYRVGRFLGRVKRAVVGVVALLVNGTIKESRGVTGKLPGLSLSVIPEETIIWGAPPAPVEVPHLFPPAPAIPLIPTIFLKA